MDKERIKYLKELLKIYQNGGHSVGKSTIFKTSIKLTKNEIQRREMIIRQKKLKRILK